MPEDNQTIQGKARKYSNIKYTFSLVDTAYLLVLLFLFQTSGLSGLAALKSAQLLPRYSLVLYLLIVFGIYSLLDFPLNFFHSFVLEHKFCLSNQKIGDWLKDQLKSGMVSYIIFLVLFGAFYFILNAWPAKWWLIISLFWIFFSLILARLTPVIIIPLFFKYKKLSDEALRQRIISLAEKVKIRIMDVYEIDFSKKTLKANAALTGWGRTRRVILADTLKDKYSHDEIEVVIGHEFAHYKLKHLIKMIFINSLAAVFSFYFIFKTSGSALKLFGLFSLSELAAFPVIMIYLVLFGIIIQPFQNYISRIFERNADKIALSVTDKKDAFISMMEKLASQNLADRNPHPIIKIFFFDHPPIDERIQMAKT